MDSKEQLLGISICDNCQSRIRVLEKHKRLVGKSVRCPKCHTLFSLSIEPPTTPEVQAIEAEEARSPTQS